MGNKSTSFNKSMDIIINNRTICLSTPKIMGILNVTPDSFFDGGKYGNYDKMLKKVNQMVSDGADIIDIGAVSTRPGAKNISVEDELKRLIEPIKLLSSAFPSTLFSVDTYRAKVAEESITAGAHIINDISGGTMDSQMFETIAALKIPYILMHIHGTPQTMQNYPIEKNVVNIVNRFFEDSVTKLLELGVENIILDPGFGFGKSLESNYELLANLKKFITFNLPILAGVSRKSMINKVLNTSPSEALNGTTSLNTIALQQGANILRVHDVKEAKEVIDIVGFMNKVTGE